MKYFLLLCLLFSFTGSLMAAETELKAGMVISQSVTILPKTYRLDVTADTIPLIQVEGKNIVVDFNHAVLQGSDHTEKPDEFTGIAIRIRKGASNITILNAAVHGYKIAILAEDVKNLTIKNCDLSYNYRQQLKSNLDREDVSDWMSYHKNEKDEWKRYGAAIYLRNCISATVQNNIVTGGQCGLMMTSCEKAWVSDNDFSFNSGIGIGLYRSSNNSIVHNKLDFNVRGYSDGKYKRGQDSAAILLFEQSSNNLIVYNSATHSGDGFFLWAGQHTMDTGEGGSNDNFIYGNDFSYAPTNGVEITFSSNLVMKNNIRDCDHGVWGGYSYNTDITDNRFENNRIGIAIEHGQNINIALNSFTNDKTGIKLWSREKQPSDWIYPQKRNTESRNYWIAANRFTGNEKAFDIMGTDTVVFSGNIKLGVAEPLVLGDRVDNIDTSREAEFLDMDYQKDERLKKIKDTSYPAPSFPQGKKEIRITRWGPYDFRYPLLWLQKKEPAGVCRFEILGPAGSGWEIKSTQGFSILEKGNDHFPSYLIAKADSSAQERNIVLSYTGNDFTDAFGRKKEGVSHPAFFYEEWDPQTQWTVNWYQWTAENDPGKGFELFEKKLAAQNPVSTAVTPSVDYTWWGAIGKGLPADSFATVAAAKMNLAANSYEIGITADDFVKVFVDGKELIDAWDSHYTELDENTHHRVQLKLEAGEHNFRIVHAEKTGLATLQFYIRPSTPTALQQP